MPVADDRKIPWTKPEDIVFGPEFPRPGEPGGIAAPYAAPAGKGRVVPMSVADGPVHQFLDTMDMETLRALITFRAADFARNRDKFVLSETRPISELQIIKFIKTQDGKTNVVIE